MELFDNKTLFLIIQLHVLVSFPLLPGTRNQSNISTNAVRLVVSGIDGGMKDGGEVETNGDMLGL